MKTLKLFSFLPLFIIFAMGSVAQQTKTETIPVSGNCGMCKTKIEKTAREAGAEKAEWSATTKTLTISYNSSTTNAGKVQQAIANVGYDTRDFKTTDEAYNKLPACCQYVRTAATAESHHCSGKCEMKDGKCSHPEVCKDKGCCNEGGDGMECCKNGACDKHS